VPLKAVITHTGRGHRLGDQADHGWRAIQNRIADSPAADMRSETIPTAAVGLRALIEWSDLATLSRAVFSSRLALASLANRAHSTGDRSFASMLVVFLRPYH